MLLIAIGHGPSSDPYSCSIATRSKTTEQESLDPDDCKACLDYICKTQELTPDCIDELLVVYNSSHNAEASVMRHYTAANGDWEQSGLTLQVCRTNGTHLTNCDADGYCNFCGCQDPA